MVMVRPWTIFAGLAGLALALPGSCPPPKNGTVHSVYFRALWGDHDNWYHFIYGRLIPFFAWAKDHVGPGDAILFLDDDEKKKDRWLPFLLKQFFAPATCSYPIVTYSAFLRPGEEIPSLDDGPLRLALRNEWGLEYNATVRALQWPKERGWDMLLYGCSSLSGASRRQIFRELQDATSLVATVCGCNRTVTSPMAHKKTMFGRRRRRKVITMIDRGPKDRKRSIPNLDDVQTALQSLEEDVAVQRVTFNNLTPCDQWCIVHESTILIGQHGAGLANAALLRGEDAGLMEIAPGATAFKTMYPCIARLKGIHFRRVKQNGTHSPVDPEAVVQAARDLLAKVGTGNDDPFPKSKLSKHMMTSQCPPLKGHHTSSLVRSGQCPNLLDREDAKKDDFTYDDDDDERNATDGPAPKIFCFDGFYDRNDAAMRCSYAVATMANSRSLREFKFFFRTFARYDVRPLYVACDARVTEYILGNNPRNVQVRLLPVLDKYNGTPRTTLIKQKKDDLNAWSEFQLEKATVIRRALNDGYRGVLYVDCDLIFLGPAPAMGLEQLGLSPHRGNSHFLRQYGTFNGGMLFVRNATILTEWRRLTRTARYFEQSSLDPLSKAVPHFIIDPRSNVGWYQAGHLQSRDSKDHILDFQLDDDDRITFQGRIVQSIHAHVLPGTPPKYYPADLAAHLISLLLRTPGLQEDLCAVAPDLCRPPDPVVHHRLSSSALVDGSSSSRSRSGRTFRRRRR